MESTRLRIAIPWLMWERLLTFEPRCCILAVYRLYTVPGPKDVVSSVFTSDPAHRLGQREAASRGDSIGCQLVGDGINNSAGDV